MVFGFLPLCEIAGNREYDRGYLWYYILCHLLSNVDLDEWCFVFITTV